MTSSKRPVYTKKNAYGKPMYLFYVGDGHATPLNKWIVGRSYAVNGDPAKGVPQEADFRSAETGEYPDKVLQWEESNGVRWQPTERGFTVVAA